MITLSRNSLYEINKQGEAEYPHECCGFLFGTIDATGKKIVHRILPIPNAREDQARHNRFLITPQDFMHGELVARKEKLDIVGFYHSHPDHPAQPSAYDLEHAWPVYSYIIVAVHERVAQDVTSWVLSNDRTQFVVEIIQKGE